MSLQTLSDDILSNLICPQCYLYLSVGPVMIDKKCGRCNYATHKTSTKSLFCIISENFLFKCCNHLNGCKQVLVPELMAIHEIECPYRTAQQECFFCSLTGNFMQIYNHLMKDHLDHISFDGVVSLPLNNSKFETIIVYQQHSNIFFISFELKPDGQLGVLVLLLAKNSASAIIQYSLRFSKSLGPRNVDFVINDFGVFNENAANYFTKSWQELTNFFGTEGMLRCTVHIGKVSLEDIEQEITQRNKKLRFEENLLRSLTDSQNDTANKLNMTTNSFDQALKVIKIMSHDIFRCCECMKIYSIHLYYCKNNHGFCKTCKTDECSVCLETQGYTLLPNVVDISVTCEYPECNKLVPVMNYPEHEAFCPKRCYKCPLEGCNQVIISAKKFIEHWHCSAPALHVNKTKENFLTFERGAKVEMFYWLIKGNLYSVLLQMNQTEVQVVINECDVVSRNITFECEHDVTNNDYYHSISWKKMLVLKFWGTTVFHAQLNNYKKIKLIFH